jgi:ATP:ADP antiporter, AAA family
VSYELLEQYTLRGAIVVLAILLFIAFAPNRVHAALFKPMRRVVDVRQNEMRAMFISALYFFFTLASYFILRPIRDEMAVASGVRELPFLFAGTLTAMLVANPLYSALVARFPVRRFVAFAYGFFVLNLVCFFILWRFHVGEVITGRIFFVWTSVYNLFVVSVFWGVMADTFHSTQAKRLFGFIALGGTLGSITGSALTAFLADRAGVPNLLLISAVFLTIAVILVITFPSVDAPEDGVTAEYTKTREQSVIGGSIWAGMTHVVKSPYLAGIGVFLLLYTLGSTVLYFTQTDVIGQFYTDREARTAVLARMELTTQLLTVFGQAFLTARIIRVAGLSVTLAAVPVVSLIGFTALGATSWGILPILGTFIAFSIARRSTEFILTNPSRKILFTVIPREDKYKASSFLETFVYRAGDQIAAWGYAGLVALGLAMTGIAWVAVPFSAVYLALGAWLGRRQKEMAAAKSGGVASEAA